MHHWRALYNWLSYITIHIKYKREVIFQNDQIKPLTLIKSEASSISRQEDLIMLLIKVHIHRFQLLPNVVLTKL